MGIELISDIVPKNNGAFPTHSAIYGKGGWQQRATIAARNLIPALNRVEGMHVYVIDIDTTYRLGPGLLDADWVAVTSGGGGGVTTAANAAAASALPLGSDGSLVYVQTFRDYFAFLAAGSALTVDGVNVLATSSGGATRLVRLEIPHKTWALQATWFINASTGSDEATGLTSLLPIKSEAEFERRVGNLTVAQNTTVTLQTDLLDTDPIQPRMTLVNAVLEYVAAPVAGRSGSITTFTAKNRATNQRYQIRDTGMGGTWTTDLDRHVRMTSGAASGKISGVILDNGSQTCTLSEFTDLDGLASVPPTTGDTYEIVTARKATFGALGRMSFVNSFVQFSTLDFQAPSGFGHESLTMGAGAIFRGCTFRGIVIVNLGSYYFNNCIQMFGYMYITGGRPACYGGFVRSSGGASVLAEAGQLVLDADFICQGGSCIVGSGGSVVAGLMATFDAGSGFFSGGEGVLVGANAGFGFTGSNGSFQCETLFAGGNALWGSGNVGAGVTVNAGGNAVVDNTPTITGAGGNFRVNNLTSARAFDTTTGAYTATRACTWANFDAAVASGGFNKSAHNVEADAHLSQFTI